MTATPAPQVARLKGAFSADAKQQVSDFLASFKSFAPTLGLLYGDVDPATGTGSWSVTAFGPQTVDDLTDMYAGFGGVVCYELDGFRVLVPQLAHIGDLDGDTLEFRGTRLVCVAPAQD
jgi:hypothetical protein